MTVDKIYNCSSENMVQIKSGSIDLIVTSPPYNIDISYGNKTEKGKILESDKIFYLKNKK